MAQEASIVIVGGGATGLTTALLLAREGLGSTLVAPRPGGQDGRTAALLRSSLRLLDAIGVGAALAPHIVPLVAMRLVDDTGHLLRAPTTVFHAGEIGLDSFGGNIPNDALVAALATAIAAEDKIRWIETTATHFDVEPDGVSVHLASGGSVEASIAVAADGRNSALRQAAGIEADRWAYPQTALVANLSHEAPHSLESTEFHTAHGPVTLVPLQGDRSSLVWVDRPEAIAAAMALDQEALAMRIADKVHWLHGRMRLETAPRAYPLEGLLARRMARGRAALVGETAHSLPPIAAQGLNLGLRDVATLAEHLAESGLADMPAALARYDAARRADVFSRSYAVDMLNRSLLGSLLPFGPIRALGLGALRRSSTLRRALMRRGMASVGGLPRLMRDDQPAPGSEPAWMR